MTTRERLVAAREHAARTLVCSDSIRSAACTRRRAADATARAYGGTRSPPRLRLSARSCANVTPRRARPQTLHQPIDMLERSSTEPSANVTAPASRGRSSDAATLRPRQRPLNHRGGGRAVPQPPRARQRPLEHHGVIERYRNAPPSPRSREHHRGVRHTGDEAVPPPHPRLHVLLEHQIPSFATACKIRRLRARRSTGARPPLCSDLTRSARLTRQMPAPSRQIPAGRAAAAPRPAAPCSAPRP
jgi:hypothetical protein